MRRLLIYFMKNLFLLFIIFTGMNMNVAATTWTITTNTGDNTDAASFGYAFSNANDGDIIEFNIAGTDTIPLTGALSRNDASKKGTTITVNGINQATGNPIVVDGSGAGTNSIYRSKSGDISAINLNFNNMVFSKGTIAGNPGGAFGLGHSSHTQVSNVKFNGCTFKDCNAGTDGGAISAGQGIALVVENCTFINNTATGNGGAISTGHSSTSPENSSIISNCTFYGNTAGGTGGALNSNPNADIPAQVISCTFVENTATTSGGGVFAGTRNTTTAVNCIVAENTPDDVFGAKLDLENCIVQTKDASVATDNNPAVYDATVFAGDAAALKNNGGHTQTIAISNNGAAYKAGIATLTGFDIPTTDQRGVIRQDPPCIGAFEAPSKIWTITTNIGDASAGSFAEAFAKAVDRDTIVFNIAGSDTIALAASLSRGTSSTYTQYQGTTITVNGINQATGNPIVIDGSQGAAGNSIYRSHSSDYSAMHMVFNNLVFYKASGGGGGAFNLGHSSFTQVTHVKFNGCTFDECDGGTGNGGAITAGRYIDLTVENCTFINNSASQGGAVNAGNATGFSAKFINSTFYGNSATTAGGALYSSPSTTDPTQVINCTFVGNTAPQGGGVAEAGTLATTLVNCIATGNTADDVSGANLNLQNCIVETKDASVVTENNPVAYATTLFVGGAAALKDNGGST